MYDLSAAGERFLKSLEALRLQVYVDACGKLTIGWGHRVQPGEPQKIITEGQAQAFFIQDTRRILDELWRDCRGFSQNQVDALVAFIYNIGLGAWHGSTARDYVMSQLFASVPHEIKRWVHDDHKNVVPGLVARQDKTAALFATGAYD